jgi:hypothetical protein
VFPVSGGADDVLGMAFVGSRDPYRVDRIARAEFLDLVECGYISMILPEGIQGIAPRVSDGSQPYLGQSGKAGQDGLAGITESSDTDFQWFHS